MAIVQSMADTRQAILLLHNGNGTTFEFTQLQAAVNAAENGDTLLLSEGSFTLSANLSIQKGVSIIGVGQKTIIRGDIEIAIPDVIINSELGKEQKETPVVTATMFDAIQIRGKVFFWNRLSGFKMRKCWVSDGFAPLSAIYDATIDRCFIKTFYHTYLLKRITIQNSSINIIRPYGTYSADTRDSEINYINCNIGDINYQMESNAKASFINCIIKDASYNYYNVRYHTFFNTLYTEKVKNRILTSQEAGNVVEHCYVADFNSTEGDDGFLTFSFKKEDLEAGGYLGTDGTVVGIEGGQTSFTLVPSSVAVTESQLKVDPEKKQLNVTLKVQAN